MNFTKLLRTPILKKICERLLLFSGWRIFCKSNHIELLLLTSLVYINVSVSSSFFFFYLRFLCKYLFGFETKLANGKLHEELWPVLKDNLKERDWISRLLRQVWSCGICRLKFCTYWAILTITKADYNIRNSNSDLCLHSFREV